METLSVREWADRHNLPFRTVYNWIKTGKLAIVRKQVEQIRIPVNTKPIEQKRKAK